MDAKITFILPSRQRPVRFFAALNNIISFCENKNFEILCVLDKEDESMCSEDVWRKLRDKILLSPVHVFWGVSTGKVNAVNRELCRISNDTEIVVLMSDDFVVTKTGFDNDIREAASGFCGLIHFPDNFQGKNLCTFPIVTKNYLDLDGWIYHPKFYSVYADDLQQALAKKRGMYKFVDKKIIEHHHWRNNLAQKDELYLRNDTNEVYEKDRKVFEELKIEYEL